MNDLSIAFRTKSDLYRLYRSTALALLAGLSLLAACTCPAKCLSEEFDLGRQVIRFDGGPRGSRVEAGAAELSLDTTYNAKRGFGWTDAPREAFVRPELSRSRTAMTIDGVAGRRIGFRADIAAGDWYLTLWVDGERDGAGFPQLRIQGRERPLGWQDFRPSDEPNPARTKLYRVFHEKITVQSDGLLVELAGRGSDVRLLGLSLIRQVDPTTPTQRRLLNQISDAGQYPCDASLDELTAQINKAFERDPDDAFLALWLERLELISTAERYFSMRGWEWADNRTGLGMLDRLSQAVMLLDAPLNAEPELADPLAKRALFTRGRILYWLNQEWGGKSEAAGSRRDLKKLRELHPDDRLLAMYAGEKIDLPDECDCLEIVAESPAWSVAQREALCRLRQICHWWVDHCQAENGELGGKFGDDVEILRWWAPLVLAGDETAKRGWQKMADGVWQSRHVKDGYASQLRDVEHAAEFVADTAPMMVLISDDPKYVDRLTCSARLFDKLWTGRTANAHRFFRSSWFSSSEIAAEEPRGRDVEYNCRAVQAVRYLAWRRSDPEVIRLLHEWSAAWVSAALRTDKGKPKGIIPPSIEFANESINGDGPNWYEANMLWPYFDWQHFSGSMMLDQLLFTYTLTKDEQLLEPMFLALELIDSEVGGLGQSATDSPPAGSRRWATNKLIHSELFWSVVEQWRFLSGDSRWDDLIMRHGTPYGRYRLSGNERYLNEGLERLLENVRYNTPMQTTEAIHTDRVYARGAEHLKAMLTGDGIWANLSPYYAVTWEDTNEDFTALVSETGDTRLQAQLYSHSPEASRVVMRTWHLAPGEYRLTLKPAGARPRHETIKIESQGQRTPIALPGRRLLKIGLDRLK